MKTIVNKTERVITFNVLEKDKEKQKAKRFRLIPTKPLDVSNADYKELSSLSFFKACKKEGLISVENDVPEKEEKKETKGDNEDGDSGKKGKDIPPPPPKKEK